MFLIPMTYLLALKQPEHPNVPVKYSKLSDKGLKGWGLLLNFSDISVRV